MYYAKWKKAFHEDIDFHVIQYPFREQKVNIPMPKTIQQLAFNIFAENKSFFTGDYAIWGHSMGSSVGYETVMFCQKIINNPPLVFFSSGASSPCDKNTKLNNGSINKTLLNYGGINSDMLNNEAFMQYFKPIIEADFNILSNYCDNEKIPLSCPLILLQGTEDDATTNNWVKYTNHPIKLYNFKGGHFFIENYKTEIIHLMENEVREARMNNYRIGRVR